MECYGGVLADGGALEAQSKTAPLSDVHRRQCHRRQRHLRHCHGRPCHGWRHHQRLKHQRWHHHTQFQAVPSSGGSSKAVFLAGAQFGVCRIRSMRIRRAGCGVGDGKDKGWGSVGCSFLIVSVDCGIFGVMFGG